MPDPLDDGRFHLAPGRTGRGEARTHSGARSLAETIEAVRRGGADAFADPEGAGAKARDRQTDPRARARSREAEERREGRAHHSGRRFRERPGELRVSTR